MTCACGGPRRSSQASVAEKEGGLTNIDKTAHDEVHQGTRTGCKHGLSAWAASIQHLPANRSASRKEADINMLRHETAGVVLQRDHTTGHVARTDIKD